MKDQKELKGEMGQRKKKRKRRSWEGLAKLLIPKEKEQVEEVGTVKKKSQEEKKVQAINYDHQKGEEQRKEDPLSEREFHPGQRMMRDQERGMMPMIQEQEGQKEKEQKAIASESSQRMRMKEEVKQKARQKDNAFEVLLLPFQRVVVVAVAVVELVLVGVQIVKSRLQRRNQTRTISQPSAKDSKDKEEDKEREATISFDGSFPFSCFLFLFPSRSLFRCDPDKIERKAMQSDKRRQMRNGYNGQRTKEDDEEEDGKKQWMKREESGFVVLTGITPTKTLPIDKAMALACNALFAATIRMLASACSLAVPLTGK